MALAVCVHVQSSASIVVAIAIGVDRRRYIWKLLPYKCLAGTNLTVRAMLH